LFVSITYRRASAITVGDTTSDYFYNALGQMIKKTVGSTTTLLMYDEAGHLLGEYSSGGALVQETVWMGDIPVATLRPNGGSISIYYVHTDQLNAPRKVTRPSDNGLMWRWDADPFGTAVPNQNPSNLGTFVYNIRFPGQYYQAETGLHYNYFRDYDPATGRYIESDALGIRAGVNTYAYVSDTPLMEIDPLGLCEIKIRCGRVRPFGFTLGWHCGVIAPNGSEYGLGGGDGSSGSSGTATRYADPPAPSLPGQQEYPVSCKCQSCDDVQTCIQKYHDTVTPPPYRAWGPNSNTYAHRMLNNCGCSTAGAPPGARGW
jgi:RHS repeat-associated protein